MNDAGQILIVDDDAAARSSLGDALTMEGYSVELAASGEEALSLGENHEYDVVLTDLRMAGIDGLRVLREFKKSRKKSSLH